MQFFAACIIPAILTYYVAVHTHQSVNRPTAKLYRVHSRTRSYECQIAGLVTRGQKKTVHHEIYRNT